MILVSDVMVVKVNLSEAAWFEAARLLLSGREV